MKVIFALSISIMTAFSQSSPEPAAEQPAIPESPPLAPPASAAVKTLPTQLSPIEQLIHATVRIESFSSNGARSTGTGFFFSFNHSGDWSVPAVVTNKHVVAGAENGSFILTLAKENGLPDVGNSFTFNITDFAKGWIPHPDPNIDLCIFPIIPVLTQAEKMGKRFFYFCLDESLIPTAEEVDDYLGMEEILMVGYPNGLWDQKNNLPILRRGIIASHYRYDWNGKGEFLIDAACFPGSSGSPILICDMRGYRTKTRYPIDAMRIKFMGVLYAGPQFTAHGEIKIVSVPSVQRPVAETNIPNNLGIAIKAEELKAFNLLLPKKE